MKRCTQPLCSRGTGAAFRVTPPEDAHLLKLQCQPPCAEMASGAPINNWHVPYGQKSPFQDALPTSLSLGPKCCISQPRHVSFGTFQGGLPLFQCPFLAVPAAPCPSEQAEEPKGPCPSPQDSDIRAEEAIGHTAGEAKGSLALSPALQSAGFWQQECKFAPNPEPPTSGGHFGGHPSTRSQPHLFSSSSFS